MDLGEKWGESGLFCQIGPITDQKVWCHCRLLNTNLFYTTTRLDWDKMEPYYKHTLRIDLGEKWGKNGLFCQVDPVTAQKVWCYGRLLNTNLFYTSNRPEWDKREPCRNDQDSNYD